MKRRTGSMLRVLPLCLALLGPGCEPAVDEEREQRTQAVRELFEVLGLTTSAEQWTRLAVGNMMQFRDALDAATIERLREAAAEAYAPRLLIDEMVEHYVDHYDPDAQRALVAYFHSPAGMEVAKAATFTGAKSLESLEGFIAKLESEPPPPERIALARRLATSTRQSEQAVMIMLGVSKTNLIAVLPLLPGGAVDSKMLEEREAQVRDDMMKRAAEQAAIASLFAFREFSEEDLRAYVEFTESGYYDWYIQQLAPAMSRAIAAARGQLEERVAALAS
jgi:hypothetical protein